MPDSGINTVFAFVPIAVLVVIAFVSVIGGSTVSRGRPGLRQRRTLSNVSLEKQNAELLPSQTASAMSKSKQPTTRSNHSASHGISLSKHDDISFMGNVYDFVKSIY